MAGLSALAALPARAAAPSQARMDAAFNYAYPLFEFGRAMQRIGTTLPNPRPPAERLNFMFQRRTLADEKSRQITSPNNDTVYNSAFLELSGGPVELNVPDVTDRYFSVAFMDAFTDNFHYIGTRATGGRGGRFWVVGPDWQGAAPAGVGLIRSSTNDVWLLARILVAGPHDLAAANVVQDQIRLVLPPGRPPARPLERPMVDGRDGLQVLRAANELLGRSARQQGQAVRAAAFADLGLRPERGAPAELSPALAAAWAETGPRGIERLRARFLSETRPTSNGWGASTAEIGNFGVNDELRAAVALGGLAALGSEEAMYFNSILDSRGEPLQPGRRYRIRIPADVPVDGFWSVTMYAAEGDGRFFYVPNPLSRFSVSERTPGLMRRPDGSIVLFISSQPPASPAEGNWLPAPDGPFRLSFRAYIPRDEIRQGGWAPPPIERL